MKMYCIYGHGKETEVCTTVEIKIYPPFDAAVRVRDLIGVDCSETGRPVVLLTCYSLLGTLGANMTETYHMQTNQIHNALIRRIVRSEAYIPELLTKQFYAHRSTCRFSARTGLTPPSRKMVGGYLL